MNMVKSSFLVYLCLTWVWLLCACGVADKPVQVVAPTLIATPTVLQIVNIDEWQARWLKAEPCSAPCWEGITPGKTDINEAYSIIQRNPLFTNIKLVSSFEHKKNNLITWNWTNSNGKSATGGEITFYENNQQVKKIYPYYAKLHFKLSQLVGAYGFPSFIQVNTMPGYMMREGYKGNGYFLRVIYVPQGLTMYASYFDKPSINGNLTLEEPQFFPADGSVFSTVTKNYLIKWQGYNTFDFYCQNQNQCIDFS